MIYFAQLRGGGAIKIGYASDVKKRFRTLQIGNWKTLRCLALIRGTKLDERRLHERFRESHRRGEWFKPTKELKSYIKSLNSVDTVQPTGASAIKRTDVGLMTVAEVAMLLRCAPETVSRRFAKEKGVVDLSVTGDLNRRRYRILRIPRALVEKYISDGQADVLKAQWGTITPQPPLPRALKVVVHVRHKVSCPSRCEGESYQNCQCPKYLRYSKDGKRYRTPAKDAGMGCSGTSRSDFAEPTERCPVSNSVSMNQETSILCRFCD